MLKTLTKSGSSKVLVISKEMIAHLGLEEDRVEVEYVEGRIILSRPPAESPVQAVGNLPQTAFEQFEANEQGWQGSVKYTRGDVVWVGVEKFAEGGAKDRPVVILSGWPCNGSFDYLVCICSSSKIIDPYYTPLKGSDFETGGLAGEGFIRPSYMTVVVQNDIRKLAGRLNGDKIAGVMATLQKILS